MSTSTTQLQMTLSLSQRSLTLSVAVTFAFCLAAACSHAMEITEAIQNTQPKTVKIYGAGGVRGLESYQSGFLISAEGHILTVWSYVLDAEPVLVTLSSGKRYEAELVGVDPRLEVAVLKIDADGLPHFSLDEAAILQPGDRILAFSNLYGIATGDEPNSVLYGTVSTSTNLSARRGVFKTPYNGPVYVLDAVTNNSGAAGGVLTNHRGIVAGILGKELRNADTNSWLNYAIPIAELRNSVLDIREGRTPVAAKMEEVPQADSPWTSGMLGVRLVPNLLTLTPPYVERVIRGTPADKAGLRADDLILFVDRALVRSLTDFDQQLRAVENDVPLALTIMRDKEIEIVEIEPDTK